MKNFGFKLSLFFYFAVLGGCFYTIHHIPKPKAKAPITRYHGYELNHAAIERAKKFTVLISAEGFGGLWRGSGVLIDPIHILTCYHIAAEPNEEFWVYTHPGRVVYRAKPIYGDQRVDLAIMQLDRPVTGTSFPTFAPRHFNGEPVFQERHYDGEPITIIGNIEGAMKWFVSYGIVSGENSYDLYTDGLVLGGDSGGPWVNERGEVVALTSWGLHDAKDRPTGISGGTSAKTIHKFLKDWKEPSLFSILLGGLQ
jgi:S1-C subfamily serine protease